MSDQDPLDTKELCLSARTFFLRKRPQANSKETELATESNATNLSPPRIPTSRIESANRKDNSKSPNSKRRAKSSTQELSKSEESLPRKESIPFSLYDDAVILRALQLEDLYVQNDFNKELMLKLGRCYSSLKCRLRGLRGLSKKDQDSIIRKADADLAEAKVIRLNLSKLKFESYVSQSLETNTDANEKSLTGAEPAKESISLAQSKARLQAFISRMPKSREEKIQNETDWYKELIDDQGFDSLQANKKSTETTSSGRVLLTPRQNDLDIKVEKPLITTKPVSRKSLKMRARFLANRFEIMQHQRREWAADLLAEILNLWANLYQISIDHLSSLINVPFGSTLCMQAVLDLVTDIGCMGKLEL